MNDPMRNVNKETVEQSDVEEINNKADIIAEIADRIRSKAFSLRDLAKPEPEGKSGEARPAGDFASEIKNRLDRIRHILDEAAESLGRFAG